MDGIVDEQVVVVVVSQEVLPVRNKVVEGFEGSEGGNEAVPNEVQVVLGTSDPSEYKSANIFGVNLYTSDFVNGIRDVLVLVVGVEIKVSSVGTVEVFKVGSVVSVKSYLHFLGPVGCEFGDCLSLQYYSDQKGVLSG